MTLTFEAERGFGVYIHWPFCTQICPYCDFNVYAAKTRDPAPLVDAILNDLTYWRDQSGPRRVDSVFFGGGTPSLIPASSVSRVIAKIDQLWGLAGNAEISLEANPEEADRFADLADAGVTRLSLGVQSLNDNELKFLGRAHDAKSARAAIDKVQGRFESLSLDFIYALPDQSLDEWKTALREALSLGADHYSLYELTIEPGAAFSRAVKRGAWTPADEDRAADLYDLTQELTEDAGYPAYEISNHARGEAHQARHNMIYWRSGDWIGVGPGAHGRLTAGGRRLTSVAERRPAGYISRVKNGGGGAADLEPQTPNDVAAERLIMGLRMMSGIDKTGVETLINRPISIQALAELSSQGLIESNDDRIALTRSGMLLADYVSTQLIDWVGEEA